MLAHRLVTHIQSVVLICFRSRKSRLGKRDSSCLKCRVLCQSSFGPIPNKGHRSYVGTSIVFHIRMYSTQVSRWKWQISRSIGGSLTTKTTTGNEGRTLGDRSQTGAIQQGDLGEIVGRVQEVGASKIDMYSEAVFIFPTVVVLILHPYKAVMKWIHWIVCSQMFTCLHMKDVTTFLQMKRCTHIYNCCSHDICFGWMTQPSAMQ